MMYKRAYDLQIRMTTSFMVSDCPLSAAYDRPRGLDEEHDDRIAEWGFSSRSVLMNKLWSSHFSHG